MADPPHQSQNPLLLDAALESIPYGFCVWSSEFRLVMWNRHYLELYGFSPARIERGMTLAEIVTLSVQSGNHPGRTAEDFLAEYQAALLANREGARVKAREQAAANRVIETTHVFSPGLGWVVTHEDITEELAIAELAQKRERDLEQQNVRLEVTVNNIAQGLCMYDAQGRLVICNAPYARIYRLPERLLQPGTQLEEILGFLFDHGMSAGDDREAYIGWRRAVIARGEFGKNIHVINGRTILMQHHPIEGGGWVSTHDDITEQLEQEERIRHLARHDALTGLPNRVRFLEELSTLAASLARSGNAALLHIDLDHFMNVNDLHGNAVGDTVLRQVAARLAGTTRETDVLARMGADEFALLLRPIERPADAAAVAERVVRAMATPFVVADRHVTIGASVGIAVAPQDGDNADRLMKSADLALSRAKAEGGGAFHFFERDIDIATRRRREIEAGLRTALVNGELCLEFQPLVGLRENRITCLEALLRWDSPMGPISPSEFVPVAEESGLIVPIGDWALRMACQSAAQWPNSVRVAVNLSAAQFRRGRLLDAVNGALSESGLSPTRLELEITESLLLSDNEPTLKMLHQLRALGVRISMDDFGTGYSSLASLEQLPLDRVKLDRSLIAGIDGSGRAASIANAIINLCRDLGVAVTAEGVERAAQLAMLHDKGITLQGYLFSRPVAENQLFVIVDQIPLLLQALLTQDPERADVVPLQEMTARRRRASAGVAEG